MPISVEKARGITTEKHGIMCTAVRSFEVDDGFYKAFGGPQVKLNIEGPRGATIEKILLDPKKARELATALNLAAETAEHKYKDLT